MKIFVLISRILLGLIFLTFGLIGLLSLVPKQPMPDGLMKQYVDVLSASHYTQIVSAIEVASALLFLINRFVPLALVLIGPVIVNILLFHILMAPSTILPGLVVTILWFIVFYAHRSAFSGIFAAKA
jgi:putative oxidoreductase